MTTLTSNYNYMDFLKQYNYVPETIENSNSLIATVIGLFEDFLCNIQAETTNSDFMSLIKEKTNNAGGILLASNDNEAFLQRA